MGLCNAACGVMSVLLQHLEEGLEREVQFLLLLEAGFELLYNTPVLCL